jgi:hypothetical protein
VTDRPPEPEEGRHRSDRAGRPPAEMQKSYLDYAMSVIVGRALPDVRDGSSRCTAASSTRCTTAATAPTAASSSAPAWSAT